MVKHAAIYFILFLPAWGCNLKEQDFDVILQLFSAPSDVDMYNNFFDFHYSSIFDHYIPPTFLASNLPEQTARIIVNLIESKPHYREDFVEWLGTVNYTVKPTAEIWKDVKAVADVVRWYDSAILEATIANAGNFPAIRSAYRGFTLLHMFAYHGKEDGLVSVIQKAKALNQLYYLIELPDSYGYTAGQLACQRGFHSLAKLLDEPCYYGSWKYPFQPSITPRTYFGKWPSHIEPSLSSSVCNIHQVHGKLTRKQIRELSRYGIPVIIRDALKKRKSIQKAFSVSNLAAFGDTLISIGDIPYGKLFQQEDSTQMRASEFMKGIADGLLNDDEYDRRIGFEKFTRDDRNSLKKMVRKLKIPFIRDKFQFSVGGPGSGAPLHYHGSALNVLPIGAKRWFFRTPANPVWSYEPPFQWFQQNGEEIGAYDFECTQFASDVVIVPTGWTHGTLNTAFTISLSVEFEDENILDSARSVETWQCLNQG